MRAAVDRRSRGGALFDTAESLTPEQALALFSKPADAAGAAARRVVVGADADLCLLDRPWSSARETLRCEHVTATIRAGNTTFRRGFD